MPSPLEELDTYRDTVWALLALHHELTWDDSTKQPIPDQDCDVEHGAKLTFQDKSYVTPDFALFLPDAAVVGDVKMSYARDDDEQRQEKIKEQLLSYDKALDEAKEVPDLPREQKSLVLLVHQTRLKAAGRYFAACKDEFKHKLAIIGFVRSDQASGTSLLLDLEEGEIVPDAKCKKLQERNVAILTDHLVARFPEVNFYDAEPPLLLLATFLWMHVFPLKLKEARGRRRGTEQLKIGVRDAAAILSDGYGIRQISKRARSCPSLDSTRGAFALLEKLGHAKTIDGDEYMISYRKLRREPPEGFAAALEKIEARERARQEKGAERAKQQGEGEQLDLGLKTRGSKRG